MAVFEPVILDETGKELIEVLKQQTSVLAMLAKKDTSLFNDWDSVQDIVDAGGAESVFPINGKFHEKYINVDNQNKEYDMPWRVNDFRDYELEDGSTVHGMVLQSHYATLQGVQFSNVRAFLACPNGLKAGTYHLTIGANWGNNAKKDKVYQFTLTQAVPNGGRLAGFKYMPDSSPSGWKVYSYSADGKTIAETVNVTEGSGGIDLGVMNYDTRRTITDTANFTGLKMNSMQETAYGCNRWATSAMRQWLNSSAGKGSWWKAQDEFDIAPDQLSTISGFLCGLSEDFVDKMKKVKVVTNKNTPTEGGGQDITYDKVFLPSLEEMYITKQTSNEGAFHKYWKMRAGATSPVGWWKDNDRYINYALENHNSAQTVRLRSAGAGIACHTWIVISTGFVSYGSYGSTYAYRAVPLVVI